MISNKVELRHTGIIKYKHIWSECQALINIYSSTWGHISPYTYMRHTKKRNYVEKSPEEWLLQAMANL